MCHNVSFHVGSPTIPINIPFWCQDQLIGLEFFHDFAQRIPRDEVSEIVAMVRGSALKRYGSRLQPGGDFGRERIEGIPPIYSHFFKGKRWVQNPAIIIQKYSPRETNGHWGAWKPVAPIAAAKRPAEPGSLADRTVRQRRSTWNLGKILLNSMIQNYGAFFGWFFLVNSMIQTVGTLLNIWIGWTSYKTESIMIEEW